MNYTSRYKIRIFISIREEKPCVIRVYKRGKYCSGMTADNQSTDEGTRGGQHSWQLRIITWHIPARPKAR